MFGCSGDLDSAVGRPRSRSGYWGGGSRKPALVDPPPQAATRAIRGELRWGLSSRSGLGVSKERATMWRPGSNAAAGAAVRASERASERARLRGWSSSAVERGV